MKIRVAYPVDPNTGYLIGCRSAKLCSADLRMFQIGWRVMNGSAKMKRRVERARQTERMRELYVVEGLPLTEIAKRYKIKRQAIHSRLKKIGVTGLSIGRGPGFHYK